MLYVPYRTTTVMQITEYNLLSQSTNVYPLAPKDQYMYTFLYVCMYVYTCIHVDVCIARIHTHTHHTHTPTRTHARTHALMI